MLLYQVLFGCLVGRIMIFRRNRQAFQVCIKRGCSFDFKKMTSPYIPPTGLLYNDVFKIYIASSCTINGLRTSTDTGEEEEKERSKTRGLP
jgi:hypothetical protein